MDEIFESKIVHQAHTDELHHAISQPTESIILEHTNEMRKNPGILKDLGSQSAGEGGTWGRWVASIPFILYNKAKEDGFDLDSKDPIIANREMNRFLQTPEGRACLVQGD